jgi:hypothetical protein
VPLVRAHHEEEGHRKLGRLVHGLGTQSGDRKTGSGGRVMGWWLWQRESLDGEQLEGEGKPTRRRTRRRDRGPTGPPWRAPLRSASLARHFARRGGG